MFQPSSPLSTYSGFWGILQFLKNDVLVHWYKTEQSEIQDNKLNVREIPISNTAVTVPVAGLIFYGKKKDIQWNCNKRQKSAEFFFSLDLTLNYKIIKLTCTLEADAYKFKHYSPSLAQEKEPINIFMNLGFQYDTIMF